jgi:polysaccharide deacetylase family protein (PEP-CTERM system associated)
VTVRDAGGLAAGGAIVNAMTIDVEDYFHVSNFVRTVAPASWASRESRVEANTDRLLGIFADAGVTATFFVLGWVAERAPRLVRRIADAGHEVASHGYAHRLIFDQSPDEFRADVRRGKALIEDASGARVLGYRAPSFSVTERSLWALDVLVEEGHVYDSSVYPIHHDRYGIPSAPRHAHVMQRRGGALIEVPGSTVRLGSVNLPIGGGGYFRLLPYAWTRWGISRVNAVERRPAIFYLHPWEIDPDQPRLPAGAMARFRHYHNLHRTEARLRRLLADFPFTSVRNLVSGLMPAAPPAVAAAR